MKIALIGNMNNNNFAIMRYFRDLGADAHLLLWQDDGMGDLSHFSPENDTWNIDRWSNYIHRTDLTNAFPAVIGNPKKLQRPLSKNIIREQLAGYDALVGSGIAPALCNRAGISLDIFYPYSTGVEFVGVAPNGKSIESEKLSRRILLSILRRKQIRGILEARHCLNAELGYTQATLDKIGRTSIPLATPMVYNQEFVSGSFVSKEMIDLRSRLEKHDLKVFSHGRQLWRKTSEFSEEIWPDMNKNNNWLILGFAELLKGNKTINPMLILLEYGTDVSESKKLCKELGIEGYVTWIPIISRKEIMYILSYCDIGVGEFTIKKGCMWGGTGWETLAAGKPLLQTFNFTINEYEERFGHLPPAILDVKDSNDVTNHLNRWYTNKDELITHGNHNKEWFNAHNGKQLAKQWLSLLS